MNELTDRELLRAYADSGSEPAFAELVSRHIAFVYSAALRIVVDPHLAEDATQATFAALAGAARPLSRRPFISSWLHRTASNQAAKLVRGEMRRRAREQEAYLMQTLPADAEREWKQIAPLLDFALNKLSEPDRAVLLLRYFDKKSAGEIGATLKLSQDTAQKRLSRALERLRRLLAGQGVSVSATTLAGLITAQAVGAVPVGLSASVSAAVLAGGMVSAGLTFATLKLIMISKLKMTAVSALVVAGVATPLIIQQRSLDRLRDDHAILQAEASQARALRAQTGKLSADLASAGQGQALTRSQRSELMRLRGEVGPLRRDSQELARLRASQAADQGKQRGQSPWPADFQPSAAWANVGNDGPEAAIQTFFWAGQHGETNLIGNLLRWQKDPAIPAEGELDRMFADGIVSATTHLAGLLQGFRVTSQQAESEGLVRLGIELTDAEGKTQAHSLRMVREEEQWFPVMNLWLEGEGSVRASLDLPPTFQ